MRTTFGAVEVPSMADPYDLAFVQGERYVRGFRYKLDGVAVPLTDWAWKAQVRAKEAPTAELLIDLTPFIVVDPEDPTRLLLTLSSADTTALGAKKFKDTAAWDLFIWPEVEPLAAVRMLYGAATMDPAATDTRA